MTEAQRKQRLLLIAGVCVALLAGDRLVLSPLASSWKSRSARIQELKKSISNGNMLLDRRDTLLKRWDAAKTQVLPADGPTAENKVLSAVNGWASSSGLSVNSLLPRWIEDEDVGPRVEVRVSGTGNLDEVSRFLYELETSEMALRLESVELRARDDAGREIALDARFSGLTSLGKEPRS